MRTPAGQGVDGWDVDLPTRLEASYICNLAAKLVWATWYIAVYGLRPIIIKPKPIGARPAPGAFWLCCTAEGVSSCCSVLAGSKHKLLAAAPECNRVRADRSTVCEQTEAPLVAWEAEAL